MEPSSPAPDSAGGRLAEVWQRARSWFRAEADEVSASIEELRTRADADLDRRERELEASPSERIDMIAAEQSSAASSQLKGLSEQLNGLLRQFRV